MKSTGIVRKVDDLGRVVLPKELRDTFDIATRDPIEIFTEGDKIIFRKYQSACIFCGEVSGTFNYRGKIICPHCAKDLAETAQITDTTQIKDTA